MFINTCSESSINIASVLGCIEAEEYTSSDMQIICFNIYVTEILLSTKYLLKTLTEYKRLSNEN